MNRKIKLLLSGLLILVLLMGNIFIFTKANKPTIWIQVGVPLSFDKAGNGASTYFRMVKNKTETDIILLAMVKAIPLTESEFPQGRPDATILVGYKGTGYPYQVWFSEESVIIGNSGPDAKFFKEIHNDHTDVIPLLKNLVDQLKNTNLRG